MTSTLKRGPSGSEPEPRARPPGRLARLWGLESRNEVLALAAILLGTRLMPDSAPLGVYGIGLVTGSALALQGIALILVYRSNRIINFAQASFGIAAAMLFSSLVQYRTFVRLMEPLCVSECLNNPALVQINYWVSLLLGLGVAVLFGWFTYFVVVRRFANAPRLVLTVATIFVGFLVVGLMSQFTQMLVPAELRESGAPPPGTEPAALPFDFVVSFGGASFHAHHFLAIAAALGALAWLFVYLRRTATGNAIRATAENPDRAATLGISVGSVTGRVWVIAAGLAGVVGVLGAMAQGTVGVAGGPAVEVRIFAVAILARMASLPLVTAAGIALGILEQSALWSFHSTLPLDSSLFVLIGILLLLQSRGMSKAEQALVGEWRAAKEIRPIPERLRALPLVRTWRRTGAAVAAVTLLGFPWIMSPGTTSLAVAVLVYTMIGLSLLVLTGWAGQISLGQVAFAATGAYVAAVLPLPLLLAIPVGGLAGSVASLVIGIPALRLRGLQLAVITLAFHLAVFSGLSPQYLGRFLLQKLERPSLLGMSLDDQRVFYYFTLLVVVGVAFAVLGMRRSRTARALIATRDNEQAAQAFGIGLTRARVGAFAVAGFISAVAGVLLAYHQGGVEPGAFDVGLSRTVFLHTVIGGLGTIAGPIIGFLYYALPLFFQLPPLAVLLLTGPGGLALLLFKPGGLAQIAFDARDDWLRRLARRNRILVPSLLGDVATYGQEEPAPLAPKMRPGGGLVFVPVRYQLRGQWAWESGGGGSGDEGVGEGAVTHEHGGRHGGDDGG